MHMFHIIDDEEDIRTILHTIISRSGHRTHEFASGNDYLTFMNTPNYTSPTAILTDYMMPGMDGYALIQHIHKKIPLQKIVLISGTPECQSSVRKDLCHILQKPFKINTLNTLISALVDCHEHHKTNELCPLNKSCVFKP